MQYEFKLLPEVLFAGVVGAATAGLEILVKFDASVVEDWETWAIAAGAAVVRGASGAALPALIRFATNLNNLLR